VVTKETFQDAQMHLEFRSPLMAKARGQQRGNSGIYIHGKYEVQILDSYGLAGWYNECGGIYRVAAPMVNMCAPPTQWQTYDIDFRGPRFNDKGEKTENARLSVVHNGVLIHKDIELPSPTGGAMKSGEQPGGGPIMLQDHGNPVQFRNVWIVKK